MPAEQLKRTPARAIRVLIIEDEGDIADVLSVRLRAAKGFEVDSAANGRDGLQRVASFAPDVVLLDIMMPGLDGWDVCRALRGDPESAELPIVLMTGFWKPESEQAARSLGVHRVLFKPLDLSKLVEALKSAAGR